MADKIYCGNGKTRKIQIQGNSIEIIKVTLSIDTLNAAMEEFGFCTGDERPKIKIDLFPRKNGPDQFGNTHTVQVDTFRPGEAPSRPGAGDGYQARPSAPPPDFPAATPQPVANEFDFSSQARTGEPQKAGEFEVSEESIDDIPFSCGG